MLNSIKNIPVIGINDEIVDDKKRPTQIMSMFYSLITQSIASLNENKIEDAPKDGKIYGRKDGVWVEIV